MTVTIYHNPRCSKSRATLALLQEKGIEPEIIEYLKAPPDAATLKSILADLDFQPRDLMRRKEPPYRENNLADEALSDDALIQAMIDDPILIERPIVRTGGQSRIGRPPESVLEIL